MSSRRRSDLQAVGEVLAEKPIWADAVELSLGKIWFPLRGWNARGWGIMFLVHFPASIREEEGAGGRTMDVWERPSGDGGVRWGEDN